MQQQMLIVKNKLLQAKKNEQKLQTKILCSSRKESN